MDKINHKENIINELTYDAIANVNFALSKSEYPIAIHKSNRAKYLKCLKLLLNSDDLPFEIKNAITDIDAALASKVNQINNAIDIQKKNEIFFVSDGTHHYSATLYDVNTSYKSAYKTILLQNPSYLTLIETIVDYNVNAHMVYVCKNIFPIISGKQWTKAKVAKTEERITVLAEYMCANKNRIRSVSGTPPKIVEDIFLML